MFSPTILNVILALQVLTTIGIYVEALPITSKPIEGTAEHLAWQAWLMLPPEQKSLEKSRKVTPKSIFTLPFRECPQGHQLFENRCIPTVNIDQEKLLTQQLLEFVQFPSDENTDNYDFDYDDMNIGVEEVQYDTAQRLSGIGDGDGSDGVGNNNNNNNNNNETYNYDQLPSQDEPLKFNIFQQKYPTDYDVDSMPPHSEEHNMQSVKSTNDTTLTPTITPIAVAVSVNSLSVEEKKESSVNTTQIKNNTTTIGDLQMESTNISTNIVPAVNSERRDSHDIVTPTTAFSISDIDAIALSASPEAVSGTGSVSVPTQDVDLEQSDFAQNVQKFSLFKDDSSVHLVTSTLLNANTNNNNNNENNSNERNKQQPDLSLLLKADDLLPLPNINNKGLIVTSATLTTPTTPTTITSRTKPSFVADNEVPTLSSSSRIVISGSGNGVDTTTPLSSIDDSDENEDEEDVTDMLLYEAESTMPTLLTDLLGNDEKVAEESSEENNNKKEEHPRSVDIQNGNNDDLLIQQEGNFTTTTEPDTTTNFQLDETTVDEIHDAPTIALKELLELELAQHKISENVGVVKKSKVEPVELPPPNETERNIMPTTTIPTSNAKVSETPSPATTTVTTDRFDYQQSSISTGENHQEVYGDRNTTGHDGPQLYDNSNLRNTTKKIQTTITSSSTSTSTSASTTTPTPTTSEIDIGQELRMINELVKGDKRQQQSKGGIIKSTTTTPAIPTTTTTKTKINAQTSESGFTTVDEKSASVSSNKDKINVESTTQLISSIEEESRTTVKTTSTISITTTTTTTVEPTATIWSKIMPLLGFSASTSMSETTVKTPRQVKNSEMSSSSISTTPTTIESSINSNRSNRNSKIIRINKLSTPSISSNSKTNSNTNTDTIAADKLIMSSTQSTAVPPPPPSSSPPPTTTTNVAESIEHTSTQSSTIGSSSSSNSIGRDSNSTPKAIIDEKGEPFWWLPIGWRLDRSNDDEPSLLFRFWSTFPGNGLTSDHRE